MAIPYPHQVYVSPLLYPDNGSAAWSNQFIRTGVSTTTINSVSHATQSVAYNSINTSTFVPLGPRILFQKQNSKTPNRFCNKKSFDWAYRFMKDILLGYIYMPDRYPLRVFDPNDEPYIGEELHHTPRSIPAPFGFNLLGEGTLTLFIYGVPQLRFRSYSYNNSEYSVRLLEILPSTENNHLRLKRLFLRHMGFNCTKRDHKSMWIDGYTLDNDAFMHPDQHSSFSLIGVVKT